jgi:hypothetical protein
VEKGTSVRRAGARLALWGFIAIAAEPPWLGGERLLGIRGWAVAYNKAFPPKKLEGIEQEMYQRNTDSGDSRTYSTPASERWNCLSIRFLLLL